MLLKPFNRQPVIVFSASFRVLLRRFILCNLLLYLPLTMGFVDPEPVYISPEDLYNDAMQSFRVDTPAAYAHTEKLLRTASERGSARAQYYLWMHLNRGQFEDNHRHLEAFDWLRQSADNGFAFAQNAMGTLYQNGDGLPVDYVKAREWYVLAAAQKNAYAFLNLGHLTEGGLGVETDEAKALAYYAMGWKWSKASKDVDGEDPHLLSKYEFARILRYADKEYRDQQVPYAVSLFEEMAEEGHASAQYEYAKALQKGIGVTAHEYLAFDWFQTAAQQGHHRAMSFLSTCYFQGQGVEKDMKQAFHWALKSSEHGNVFAMAKLGMLLHLGHGPTNEEDVEGAISWWLLASDRGNTIVTDQLRDMFGDNFEEELDPFREDLAVLSKRFRTESD